MDENTWRIVQVIMAVAGIQITVLIAILGGMWIHFNRRFDSLENRFDSRFSNIEKDVRQLKDDMIEVKTILRMKECCMIQDERQMKKSG